MKIHEIMTKKVITVSAEDSLMDTVSALSINSISGLPVVEKGKVIGIITEFDLLKRLTEFYAPSYLMLLAEIKQADDPLSRKRLIEIAEVKVGDMMTEGVVTIKESQSIEDAAKVIVELDINPLPVVDKDGELSGIVSRSDIVKSVAKHKKK